jgi:hypothetical protein
MCRGLGRVGARVSGSTESQRHPQTDKFHKQSALRLMNRNPDLTNGPPNSLAEALFALFHQKH